VGKVFDALELENVAVVSRLPVTREGRLEEHVFRAALRPADTRFVSIMHANNEVGTLQNIAQLVRVAKEVCGASLVFHTDAAQSVGKIRVNVEELGVDLLTLVGHKFYAPKAIGALYVRDASVLALRVLHGGGQQHGQRAGTESALLIHALGVAAHEAHAHMDDRLANVARCRDSLWRHVQAKFPRCVRWTPAEALPNTLSVLLDPESHPAYEVVR
jgi:cysteine desulfurase